MKANGAIGITGTGSHVPRTAVTNEQLASVLDTEAEAIHRVTGIEQRRIRDERENVYVMGALAGLRALEDACLRPDQIDAIYCGIDPIGEVSVPAAANLVQYLMGLPLLRAEDGSRTPNYCPSCDVVAGCCGPLFALEAAVGRVLTVQADEFYDGGRGYFRRWNRLRSEGGGLWLTKASHDFDLLYWLSGRTAPLDLDVHAQLVRSS